MKNLILRKMNRHILIATLLALLSVGADAVAQQLAFPGAEGFGRFAVGGRTGTVYHVTNLNDSGSGSFRDAVSLPNRIIVFDVAGVIRLQSRVSVSRNLYIAGQTAPGEGITLYGNGLSFSGADNTICRYLRVRMGVVGDSGQDALTMASGHDMIFDHCSVAWGRDETFSISGDGPQNITIQNSIISQGLLGHSAGGLVQTDGGVTIYRTLYIHNDTRNPKFKGRHQYVNNIVYNWKTAAYIMGGDSEGSSQANAEGNVFIAGPTGKSNAFSGANSRYAIYENDNLVDDNHDGRLSLRRIGHDEFGGGPTFQTAPFDYPVLPTTAASGLLDDLLPVVGASLPYRDNLDWMLLADVRSFGLRGEIISDERTLDIGAPDTWGLWQGTRRFDTDGDGMPDWWEEQNGTDPAKADAMQLQDDGYVNIEHYINSISAEQSEYFLKVPQALRAAERESASLLLEWRDMTDHESGYSVEQLVDGEYVEIGRTRSGQNTWSVEGLAPATSYTFRVRAFDSDGYSGYSNVLTSTTRAQAADVTSPDKYTADVVWRGTESADWDLQTANWEDADGVGTTFAEGQRVLFDDNGVATVVKIPAPVAPAAVMVRGHHDYQIDGVIGGTGQLTMAGSGTLSLTGKNTFSGSTVIWDGTLEIGTIGNGGVASPLGTSPTWVWNGGTVRYTGPSASTNREVSLMRPTTIEVTTSGTRLTQNGAVTGEGDLVKAGPGTLTLPLGALTHTGATIVKGGTLTVQGKDALGTNPQLRGPLHLDGGRFEVTGGDNAAEGIINFPVVVEDGATSYLHIGQRNYIKGAFSGSGNLVLEVEYLREFYQGDWRQFYGTVTARQTGTQGNQFYVDNATYGGLPNCHLHLAGTLEMRSGTNSKTYSIGALSGTSTTTLACTFIKKDGGVVTWRIGGLGTDETFNGKITNGIEHSSRIGLTNIVKEGEGYWRLTGAQRYRGTTRIEGGTLIQNGAHSQDKDHTGTYFVPGQYTVCDSALLAGKGSTEAPVVVERGGGIAPGDMAVGTFTVKNDVSLKAGSHLYVEVNRQAKTSDRLTCQGKLTAGGTLHVQLLDGGYAAGDAIAVLSAKSYGGAFEAIEPEVPADGLAWDTSTLLTDGRLRVVDDTSAISTLRDEKPGAVWVTTLSGIPVARLSSWDADERRALPAGVYIVTSSGKSKVVRVGK